jgi:hypothetical protein
MLQLHLKPGPLYFPAVLANKVPLLNLAVDAFLPHKKVNTVITAPSTKPKE